MRPSWIEIDLAAIRSNAAAIREAVAPAALCAVVKADGYGHGDIPAASAALEGGASLLAVALVEEGRGLREAGIDAPILLLSEPAAEDVGSVVEFDLTPTVYRTATSAAIGDAAAKIGRAPYPVHVKIDTGMHRVGAPPIEAFPLVRSIAGDDRLDLAGVWTHFAVSEEDTEYTKRQNNALIEFSAQLSAEGISPGLLHAANTAGALDYPEARHDLVRVGLGLYGLRPAADSGADVALVPAMRVVSHVSYVRRLPPGARPSYGRVRALDHAATVATVPIGYADGVARRLSMLGGDVLIGGVRYPFAGSVTMDQIVIDCGDDPVEEGAEVVLLGTQGEEAITAEEWAERLGTINYEIVCDFGPRMPRRYRDDRG